MSLIRQREEEKPFSYNKNVDYYVPKDLGYTLGTVFKNLQVWTTKELEHVVKFQHTYIDTTVMYEKTFLWSKGILAQARKPTLSLQFSMDFVEDRSPWATPAYKNLEAAKWLSPRDFTHPMFQFEDDKDIRNNMQVSFAMKNVKCTLNVGVATSTRMEAVNIVNYWTTRRTDGYHYNLDMVIDFKIPPAIIYVICEKYGINIKNHHQVLHFLNKNSIYNVFYGMDGSYGKFYYFIRYKTNFLIRPEGVTNPQGWEIQGTTQHNTWTLTRNFEMDIQIPSIIAITKYGDRLDFREIESNLQDELLSDLYNTGVANIQLNERVLEIERVITDKHAIKQVNFSFTEEDIKESENGVRQTDKIEISSFIEEDLEIKKYVEWALENGYTYLDLFNFKLYRTKITEWEQSAEIREYDALTGETNYAENVFGDEYNYYIKNIKDMYFIDVNPNVNCVYTGIIYTNLKIFNEYKSKSDYYKHHIANDDFGIQNPTGDIVNRSHIDDSNKTDKLWY